MNLLLHQYYCQSCDVRTTSASTGYLGASGSGNVFLEPLLPIRVILSSVNQYPKLYWSHTSIGLLRANVSGCTTEAMVVEVSSDGVIWTPLTYTQPAINVWTLITASGTIPAVPNLSIRFSKIYLCPPYR